MYIKKIYNNNPSNTYPFFPENRLTPDYWLSRIKDKTIMNREEIKAFNQRLLTTNENITDPLAHPSTLSRSEVVNLIDSISIKPTKPMFYASGASISEEQLVAYLENTGKKQLADINDVHYGLVIKRASLRTFPTADRVFDSNMDLDLDRFQETAIYTGQPVAIICHSTDGLWLLIRSYNYLAWIEAEKVAIADSIQQLRNFTESEHYLIVTGPRVLTAYNPEIAETSEQSLDMGVRLPLLVDAEKPQQLHRQSTYMSHVVMLPTRETDGSLSLQAAMISKQADVQTAYLDYTSSNIIHQAFKLAGERYGWGGSFNSRDCSSMVLDVYQCFGIIMPRNTSQQAKPNYGSNTEFDSNTSLADKLEVLKTVETGDIFYMPGHCLMVLGHDEDDFVYVINDVKSITYLDNAANMTTMSLNGVFVTRLLDMHTSDSINYLRKITNIKRIINQD